MGSQKQERHGGNRGVYEKHRGEAPESVYRAVPDAQLTVIPIEPFESGATRLPPFGREVEAAISAGKNPNVYLYAGRDSWQQARMRVARTSVGKTLLLPPGEDPNSYRWPAVPGGVFIVGIGEPRARIFALAHAVVSCGSPMAYAV
ncbi:MAG: hypothetical protein JSS59_06770, partial [Proteobacteria bacterium]|nr:hypothetical protein [Pseudomonadota bacterium]